jgi:hypothetical protein
MTSTSSCERPSNGISAVYTHILSMTITFLKVEKSPDEIISEFPTDETR